MSDPAKTTQKIEQLRLFREPSYVAWEALFKDYPFLSYKHSTLIINIDSLNVQESDDE